MAQPIQPVTLSEAFIAFIPAAIVYAFSIFIFYWFFWKKSTISRDFYIVTLFSSILSFLLTVFVYQYDLMHTYSPFLVGLGSSLILVGILFFFISFANWRIITPIVEIIRYQERITEGDLSESFPELKATGEVKSLVTTTKRLVEAIQAIMAKLQESSRNLAESSEELAAGSEEISATSEEITGTIQVIAEGAAEQVRKIDEVSKILTELIRVSEDSIREISKASKLTQDLAEQTNLIALNAAIEAARAGDYGRGFGVVAENVRKLSVQSKQAASQINLSTQRIEERIRSAVENVTKAIQDVVSVAENTAAGAEQAAAASQEQSSTMSEITQNAQALAQLSDETKALTEMFKLKIVKGKA